MPASTAYGAAPSADFMRERTRLFKKIRMHSRIVRFLRIFLPVSALALIAALVFAVNFISRLDTGFELDQGTLSFNGSAIVMNNPKLNGFGADGQSYEVRAATATQSITRAHRIDLEKLAAKIMLADDTWADVRSDSGIYDTNNTILTLEDEILVASSEGYSMKLQEAEIDFKASQLRSEARIEVTSARGFLQANGLVVDQSGQRIRFTNGVRLIVVPPHSEGKLGTERP